MPRSLVWVLAVGLIVTEIGTAAEPPTYWQDVRPILRRHCTVCHKASKAADIEVSAGLALDTLEAIQAKRKVAVFTPKKPDDSLLVTLLTAKNLNRRMPLDAEPLSMAEIKTIRDWVAAGGPAGEQPTTETTTAPTVSNLKLRQLPVVLPTKLLADKAKTPVRLSLPIGPLPPITAVRFSPDGTRLAMASYGQVTLWNLAKAQPSVLLKSVLGAVHDVRFSPDGKQLAVAGGQPSARGDLRLFDAQTGRLLHSLGGHLDTVSAVAFTPDGQKLASASFDKTVRIWETASGKLLQTFSGHSDSVYAVAFSPSGDWYVTASKDRSCRLVELASGTSKFTFSGTDLELSAVEVNADGTRVVTSGADGRISWWDTKTGERIRRDNGHGSPVTEIGLAPNGTLLATASTDRTVRLWNPKTGAAQQTLAAQSVVFSVDLDAQGRRVAAGCADGLVRIWETKSGQQLATLLNSTRETDSWLAITPDGYFHSGTSLQSRFNWLGIAPDGVEKIMKLLKGPTRVVAALRGDSAPPK